MQSCLFQIYLYENKMHNMHNMHKIGKKYAQYVNKHAKIMQKICKKNMQKL